jgi:hypothetical protein
VPCLGNSADHCCYLAGKPCTFLEENTVEGRRWACGLRRELGDWDAVLASDRYKETVAPVFEHLGMNCRDWPDGPGDGCGTCGIRN